MRPPPVKILGATESKYLVFVLYKEYVPIPALETWCSFIKSCLEGFEAAS